MSNQTSTIQDESPKGQPLNWGAFNIPVIPDVHELSATPTERSVGGRDNVIQYLTNGIEVTGFICNEVPYATPDRKEEVVQKYYTELMAELKLEESPTLMLPRYSVKIKDGALVFEKSEAVKTSKIAFKAKKDGSGVASHAKVVALIAYKNTDDKTQELNVAAAIEEYNKYMEEHKGYYKINNTMQRPQYLVLAPIDQNTGDGEFTTHFSDNTLGAGIFESREGFCKIVRPKTFLQSIATNFAGTDLFPMVGVKTYIQKTPVHALTLAPLVVAKDGAHKISLNYFVNGIDKDQLRSKGIVNQAYKNIVEVLSKAGMTASFAFLHDSRDKNTAKIAKTDLSTKSQDEKANLSAIMNENFPTFGDSYVKMVAPPRTIGAEKEVNEDYTKYLEARKLKFANNKAALKSMGVPASTFEVLINRKQSTKSVKVYTKEMLATNWRTLSSSDFIF